MHKIKAIFLIIGRQRRTILVTIMLLAALFLAVGCRAKKEASQESKSQVSRSQEHKAQGAAVLTDQSQVSTQEATKSGQDATIETTIKTGGQVIKVDPVKGFEGPADEVSIKGRYKASHEASKTQDEKRDVSLQASGSQENKSQEQNSQNVKAIEVTPERKSFIDQLRGLIYGLIVLIIVGSAAYGLYKLKK